MVYFLLPSMQLHTFGPFLEAARDKVRDRIQVVTLDWVAHQKRIPAGTYLFSGLCVSTDVARRVACEIAAKLEAGGQATRLLNDPRRVLWRYELLDRLYKEGINRFRAYRYSELATRTPRFPVFLRSERMHTGALTPILHTSPEVRTAYAELRRQGLPVEQILTVEYLHAPGADGLFRKYTAYRVGDALIPRYVTWSPHWVVKRHPKDLQQDDPEIPRLVREEFEYAQSDPYREVIRRAFDIANIEYGRLDFTVCEGIPQVFEINTAPLLSPSDLLRPQPDWLNRLREPTKDLFYDRFFPALLNVDGPEGGEPIDLTLDPALIQRFVDEDPGLRSTTFWLRTYRNIRRRWPRRGPLAAVRYLARPMLRRLIKRV